MSFSSLLDHTARIWRRTVTLGSLKQEQIAYVPEEVVPCTVKRPVASLGDAGPGFAPLGDRKVYLEAAVIVGERDVVELLTGPDAPEVLEVDAPPTRPRGHHLELICRIFLGVLPSVETS